MFIEMINKYEEIVTIQQAMDLVHVSRRTIYNWMKSNKIDWTRVPSGNIRIIKNTLFKMEDTSYRTSNL